MSNIKLQSSDGEIFDVDVEVAKCSSTIKTMIEKLGNSKEEEKVVQLPNVRADILKKILQWLSYHKDDPPPSEEDEAKPKRSDDMSAWDEEFLYVDHGTLYELITAADYFNIKSLSIATSKTIANLIKGNSIEEIREIFFVKNDFTPAEEEEIRKENGWCSKK